MNWGIMLLGLGAVIISNELFDRLVFKEFRPEPQIIFRIVNVYIPFVIMSVFPGMGKTLFPVTIVDKPLMPTFILLLIAVLPSVVGTVEGFAYGFICNYHNRPFSLREIAEYSKNGQKGSDGRYDISIEHISFAMISNISGAACTISLLWFAHSIPQYVEFARNTDWLIYLNFLLPLSVGLALILTQTHQHINHSAENHNNFLLNRFHELFNTLHMTVTYFYCMTIIFTFWAFAIARHRPQLSWLCLLPILAAFAFLLFATASGWADKYIPESLAHFTLSPLLLVFIANIWFWIAFRESWLQKIFVVVVSILILIVWFFMYKNLKKKCITVKYQNFLKLTSSFLSSGVIMCSIVFGVLQP